MPPPVDSERHYGLLSTGKVRPRLGEWWVGVLAKSAVVLLKGAGFNKPPASQALGVCDTVWGASTEPIVEVAVIKTEPAEGLL